MVSASTIACRFSGRRDQRDKIAYLLVAIIGLMRENMRFTK
jgi:hypothetical protein